jgi:hypothetical protein
MSNGSVSSCGKSMVFVTVWRPRWRKERFPRLCNGTAVLGWPKRMEAVSRRRCCWLSRGARGQRSGSQNDENVGTVCGVPLTIGSRRWEGHHVINVERVKVTQDGAALDVSWQLNMVTASRCGSLRKWNGPAEHKRTRHQPSSWCWEAVSLETTQSCGRLDRPSSSPSYRPACPSWPKFGGV